MTNLQDKIRDFASSPEVMTLSVNDIVNKVYEICGKDRQDEFYLARFHFEEVRKDVFDELLSLSMIESILRDLQKIENMNSPLASIASQTLMTMCKNHDPFVDKLADSLGELFPAWEEKMLSKINQTINSFTSHCISVGYTELEAKSKTNAHYLAEYADSRYLPNVEAFLQAA